MWDFFNRPKTSSDVSRLIRRGNVQRCEDRELFAIKEQIACINKQFDNAKMLIESDWYPEEEKMELKRSIRFLMTSLKDKQEELNCLGKRPRVVSAAVTSFINHTGIIDLCDD